MTGTHTHDHAAFGAPDHDDGSHAHKHTHQNDADHDHRHKLTDGGVTVETDGDGDTDYSMMEAALLNHVLNADFTQIMNWDAAAALAKCKSASDYRSVCAGEKSAGTPDEQQHWALPHHDSPGGPPDKGGVVAALGRWNQTEGLKNKQAALAHLKAHARALGLPSGDDKKDSDSNSWFEPSEEEVQQIINALKGA